MKTVRLSIVSKWMVAIAVWLPCVMCAQSGTSPLFVERPKVGLVLSGGGARGAAHVGAIRLIEELQIPVDYVAGTSMGAIIGALYAIGYTADEMDSLLMTRDWRVLLSNSVPRSMQPYALREDEQHYQVNIPYENSTRTENSARYRDAGIRVGRHSSRFPKVLARPGLIDGNNLLNEFADLTFAYHDSVSYDVFPRPFACVATDLVTGNAVVLDRGYLAESMRASMSIPGVFYPIYKGSQVLVDGGVVNNYPVDVARRMGAEIIIGVDLNTGPTMAAELHSFPRIFERLIGTMGSDLRRHNVESTDVLIAPMVGDYPVMGFDSVRLDQLVDIGYEAALQCRPQLEALKERLGIYAAPVVESETVLPSPLTASSDTFVLGSISVVGYDRTEMLDLLSQYGISEGRIISGDDISLAVEGIYGLGTFSSVQYHLSDQEPYALEMLVVPNPYNQVQLGFRIDSEEAAAALFSMGINELRLSGPKLDLTMRLSANPWVKAYAAYAWCGGPQVNASVKYWFSDVNRFYEHSAHAFDYHYYGSDLFLSDLLSRAYDLRLGARYDHFLVRGLRHDELPARSYADTGDRDSYVGLYVSLRDDLFDAAYLPTSGYTYGVEAAYSMNNRKHSCFGTLQADASAAFPLTRTTVLQPAVYMRMLWGGDVPSVYANSLGGYLPGRYMRQQIPFVGLTGCEFMQRQLAVLRLDVRQQLVPDFYLSAIANYAYSTNRLRSPFEGKGLWGLAAGLTYSTTVGPLSFYTHWSDAHHRFGAYVSFGYAF